MGLIDLNSDSKETEIQTEISFFSSNDKSIQTNLKDFDDSRLSDEKFSEFEPKVNQKSEKSGKEEKIGQNSDQKSIYTYFASLSPLTKRTKEVTKSQSSVSSSLSSVKETTLQTSLQTLSPDLGIETEVNKSGNGFRKVFISIRELRKLKRFLSEILREVPKDSPIQELVTNCLNICQKFSFEENLWKKLEKMRKSKENMEKEIHKQLNKTNEMLIKTKENLKNV